MPPTRNINWQKICITPKILQLLEEGQFKKIKQKLLADEAKALHFEKLQGGAFSMRLAQDSKESSRLIAEEVVDADGKCILVINRLVQNHKYDESILSVIDLQKLETIKDIREAQVDEAPNTIIHHNSVITFNENQQTIIRNIKYESKDKAFIISGAAGSGKTLIAISLLITNDDIADNAVTSTAAADDDSSDDQLESIVSMYIAPDPALKEQLKRELNNNPAGFSLLSQGKIILYTMDELLALENLPANIHQVIVDEYQSYDKWSLAYIEKKFEGKKKVFLGDTDQDFSEDKFCKYILLKQIYSKNMVDYSLIGAYRCPESANNLLANVLGQRQEKFKQQHGSTLQQLNISNYDNSESKQGHLYLTGDVNQLSRISATLNYIVLVLNDDAKSRVLLRFKGIIGFHEGFIYTADQMKGIESKNVVLFDMFDDIYTRLTNRRGDNLQVSDYNKLVVAITRTSNSLIIFQSKENTLVYVAKTYDLEPSNESVKIKADENMGHSYQSMIKDLIAKGDEARAKIFSKQYAETMLYEFLKKRYRTGYFDDYLYNICEGIIDESERTNIIKLSELEALAVETRDKLIDEYKENNILHKDIYEQLNLLAEREKETVGITRQYSSLKSQSEKFLAEIVLFEGSRFKDSLSNKMKKTLSKKLGELSSKINNVNRSLKTLNSQLTAMQNKEAALRNAPQICMEKDSITKDIEYLRKLKEEFSVSIETLQAALTNLQQADKEVKSAVQIIKETIQPSRNQDQNKNFSSRMKFFFKCLALLVAFSVVLYIKGISKFFDNKDMCTKLFDAILDKSLLKVKMLLDAGVDVNCKRGLYSPFLYSIALKRKPSIVKLFIEAGANVNDMDDVNQMTALMLLASANENVENVRALLSKGADINRVDKYGHSALSHAVIKGFKKNVKEILLYEIDLGLKQVALSHAKDPTIQKMIQSSIDKGKKSKPNKNSHAAQIELQRIEESKNWTRY